MAENELRRRKLIRRISIEGVLSAARIAGIANDLFIDRRPGVALLASSREDLDRVLRRIRDAALDITRACEIATVDDVLNACAGVADSLVYSVLDGFDRLQWVDREGGLFQIVMRSSRLEFRTAKILSVTPRMHVADLVEGLRGNRPIRIDEERLLSYCRHLGWCRVDGEFVEAAVVLDPREFLSRTEQRFLRAMARSGGFMTIHDLRKQLRGMNEATFRALLWGSPISKRFSDEIYGLRGTMLDPQRALDLSLRTGRRRKTWGITNRNLIWILFEINRSLKLHTPRELHPVLGGPYQVLDETGRDLGIVFCGERCMFSLQWLMSGLGIRPGDLLLVIIDPVQSTIALHSNAHELAERLIAESSEA